jgi:UDP-N-acetylmuramoyl-L-alanyl-D-glutamate--2,6-diaminopimelate ligase
MMRAALAKSDVVVVTSDNPRTEDPEKIIDEILSETSLLEMGSRVYREGDRKKAIALALNLAQPGDVVLVAGKGHEDYQIIGDERIHFSDVEVIKEVLG